MKKLFYAMAMSGLAFAACQNTPGYTIAGTVEGATDGTYVYLQKQSGRELVKLDSAVIKGGKFSFEGTQDTTQMRVISYVNGNDKKYLSFFLENGKLNATIGEETKMTGTPTNDVFNAHNEKRNAAQEELRDMYMKLRNDSTMTEDQQKKLEAEFEKKSNELDAANMAFVKENITNAAGVFMLPMFSYQLELNELKELIAKIPAELVNERIDALKEHVVVVEKTSVGKKFTDFTMNTIDGKQAKLSDFISKNKYTLVDFWASWCGPCRGEMPNVVAAYKQFHKKGFGIVGVSLDSKEDQWKAAVKNLGMEWDQLSDLKGWKNEGAKLYGINSIPATVLIDQEGTIVARDLRGEAIATKLSELLK